MYTYISKKVGWKRFINNAIFTVHPCDEASKGRCEDTCTKIGDQAKCSCSKSGFKLHSDGKSCGNIAF